MTRCLIDIWNYILKEGKEKGRSSSSSLFHALKLSIHPIEIDLVFSVDVT